MSELLREGPEVARIRAEQIERWQCGDRVAIEALWAEVPNLSDDEKLDLICSEMLLREELGLPIDSADFADRFPHQAVAVVRLAEMHTMLDSVDSGDTLDDHAKPESLSEPARPTSIGAYDIVGDVGRGGMGLVFKGQHRLMPERTAAVKILRVEASKGDMVRIRAEANAAARLKHENIVSIYEFGTYCNADGDELPFVAYEFVEGGTLAGKLRDGPMSPREAGTWMVAIAESIAYAHREGIIHRDLKPSNVLIDALGRPKVADFGLAKRLDVESGQTRSGDVIGTPSYMAPEQALGQTTIHGPAADIYALGAILYELLTGRPPFRADTVIHTLDQVAHHEPVAPTRIQPTVPRDLETICLKCLRKEPSRRYASAQAMADDLRRFLAGEPITARPASAVERGVKWVKRHPTATGLWTVCAGFLVVLGVSWAHFTVNLRAERDVAREERDKAQQQRERADAILRHALFSVDSFATNARGAGGEQAQTSTGSLLFQLACSYARTANGLQSSSDLQLKDRLELAEQYAASAVRLLKCAETVGYFQTQRQNNLEALRTNADLQILRARDDFMQLAKRVGAS